MKRFSFQIALWFLLNYLFVFNAYNQRSSYCNNCLMHFGTIIDSDGVVQNKNYQFNLPDNNSLVIYVNLFDSYKRKLGFSKMHVLITKKDSKLNEIETLYDETINSVDPERWGYSFYFTVFSSGVYSVEIRDEFGRYINSGYVIVQ